MAESSELREFPCTKCGACCRLVWANSYFTSRGMVKEDGSCIHLTEDNLCGIQDTRPEVCRFNDIYVNSGLVNIVPIEIYHDRTIDSTCRVALFEAGILDPEKLPKKVYSHRDMNDVVNKYLESLGSDFQPSMHIRPNRKPLGE